MFEVKGKIILSKMDEKNRFKIQQTMDDIKFENQNFVSLTVRKRLFSNDFILSVHGLMNQYDDLKKLLIFIEKENLLKKGTIYLYPQGYKWEDILFVKNGFLFFTSSRPSAKASKILS